jgi:hypothetical protein
VEIASNQVVVQQDVLGHITSSSVQSADRLLHRRLSPPLMIDSCT